MEWKNANKELPKHLEPCVFKLDDGTFCIGKCNYFEHGDSELIEMYGKSLSYVVCIYRNWELHNFDRTKFPKVIEWSYIK